MALRLRDFVAEHLHSQPHVDAITARAKDPDSFAEKATRKDEHGGTKYSSPLTDIQDQLGVRVVVLYTDDVEPVADVIKRYFGGIEHTPRVPESEWSFGYFGYHMVLPVPGDVIPQSVDRDLVPAFFELQVKTLFQHAWSEANHDLGYKAIHELSDHDQRCLAYAAAQAWGADLMFAQLSSGLS